MIRRLVRAVRFDASQALRMWRLAADSRSVARFLLDVLRIRVLRATGRTPSNRERRIRLRSNLTLTYRLNFGDVQSIREVWLDEAYKLPFTPSAGALVDLGSNIGLTSLWLATRYQYTTLVAVEPSPANARLTRLNLESNGVPVRLIEAAVGPTDGTAYFSDEAASNLGHLSTQGRPVRVVSMATVFAELPPDEPVDLIKLDIEGGEQALVEGDLSWLDRVRGLIAEFHPEVIDYPGVIDKIRGAGFDYIAAGTAHLHSMDAFLRSGVTAASPAPSLVRG